MQSLARLIIQNNLGEVPHAEVRPQRLDELILRLVSLIKQEVAQSDFIARSDYDFRFAVEPAVELLVEVLYFYLPLFQFQLVRRIQLSKLVNSTEYFIFRIVA